MRLISLKPIDFYRITIRTNYSIVDIVWGVVSTPITDKIGFRLDISTLLNNG